MKKFNKKTIVIYSLILVYILFSNIFGYKYYSTIMTSVINPLFYIITFIISILLSNADHNQRIKAKVNKYQTMFILIISYLIIYVLLGLFLGYVKSIYSHAFLGILKNIWDYIIPIIFIELIRNILVRNSCNSKIVFLIIVLLFTLIDIDLFNIISLTNKAEIFKSTFSIILPAVIKNLSLTYISKTSGYTTNLIYLLPQKLTNIILPIFPDLDWYFISLLGILLPVFAFIIIKHLDDKIESSKSKSRLKKEKPIRIIILITPLIIFCLFVAGIFKYKPTAIVSNSMHPIFDIGDVVIIEKLDRKKSRNLKKYDIIEYKLKNIIVSHRIIHIEKHNDGSISYITKGDNNNTADNEKVSSNQIIGIVKFRIPKVGYPSVWLNDFFNKEDVEIETGK